MKTPALLLAAAFLVSSHAHAARPQDPQQVMTLDLNACLRPGFPAAALAQGAKGTTTVEVRIGETGIVTDARVAASAGRADFDEAALGAIRACVFHAVVATGQAPTGWLKTQYVWVPGGAKKEAAPDPALYAGTVALATAGDSAAQNRLGAWYEHGTYGEKDLAKAADWYRKAAESGNAIAQNNLGVLYHRGAGVLLDAKEAAYWYAKAAAQGHRWAQANLAWAYENGMGVDHDIDQALAWMTQAADGGLAYAQVRLALMAMMRATSDVERGAAAAWIARAAAQDYPPGYYYLARSFELGLGNAQDDAQAATLYRKALGRSDGRAETALGILIEARRAGAAEPDEAAVLYRKAMQARYPHAFNRYGLVLEQRGDTDLAGAVFRRGAEMGDCDATVNYVRLRQPQAAATPAAEALETYLAQRAQACAARPPLPPML
nr:TonB family protein [uncultured Massilia sp.]